jgi:hypothetical protein
VEFSVTNDGPFPIALGAGEAVNPVFLVSLALEGDRPRDFPHLLTVELEEQRVLMPGRTLSQVRRVDVGPVAKVNRRTPQHLQRAVVSAVFDPVQAPDGAWGPALAGLDAPPLSFNRLPANVTEEAWRARLANLTGDDPVACERAIDELAQLLAESQRAGLDKLGYRVEPIPAERVRRALLAALKVRDPWVRAATLSAGADLGLDAELLAAIEDNVRHEHWLVRLLAVRLLGDRKIATATGLLAEAARGDADALVKRLAASYGSAAASQASPASAE